MNLEFDNRQSMQQQNEYSSPSIGHRSKQKIHIPLCDVDDLAFKDRNDPNFVASISK